MSKSSASAVTSSVVNEQTRTRDPSQSEQLMQFTKELLQNNQRDRKMALNERYRRRIFAQTNRYPNLNIRPDEVFSPIINRFKAASSQETTDLPKSSPCKSNSIEDAQQPLPLMPTKTADDDDEEIERQRRVNVQPSTPTRTNTRIKLVKELSDQEVRSFPIISYILKFIFVCFFYIHLEVAQIT